MVIKYLAYCHKSSRGFPKPKRDIGSPIDRKICRPQMACGWGTKETSRITFLSSLITFNAYKVTAHNIFYRL